MSRLLVFAVVGTLAGAWIAEARDAFVSVSAGENGATVGVSRIEPYSGGPWAALAAKPLVDGVQPTATDFALRAWQEAGKTRIVVFAMIRAGNTR